MRIRNDTCIYHHFCGSFADTGRWLLAFVCSASGDATVAPRKHCFMCAHNMFSYTGQAGFGVAVMAAGGILRSYQGLDKGSDARCVFTNTATIGR